MKKSLLTLILLFSICYSQTSLAQSLFSKTISVEDVNYGIQCYSSCVSYDGSILLVGEIYDGKGAIIKTDQGGNLLWNQTWNCTESNRFPAFKNIINTSDSCYFIVGDYYHPTENTYRSFFMKMTENGDTLWSKSNSLTGIINSFETQDHGFIMIGSYSISGNNQTSLIKIDTNGDLEWTKILKFGTKSCEGSSIKQKANGNYLISGKYNNQGDTKSTAYLAELSSFGDVEWVKNYQDENSYIGSSIDDFININNDLFLLLSNDNIIISKTDSLGNIQWSKNNSYGGWNMYNIPNKLKKTINNELLFTNGSDFTKYFKSDLNGDIILFGELELNAIDIHTTENNGILVIGNGPLMGVKNKYYPRTNIGMIQMDEFGYGVACSYPSSYISEDYIIQESTGTFSSLELGEEDHTEMEINTIDLLLEDGCVDFTGSIEENKDDLMMILPNPNNGVFVLETNNSMEGILFIYNHMGQLIYQENQKMQQNKIDLSVQTNGIYYYQFESSHSKIVSGKFIIEK